MPPETLVLREILTMRTMKMEFWILYMDHVYDKPVTIASELRTKATTMQQGKIDNIHILKYLFEGFSSKFLLSSLSSNI